MDKKYYQKTHPESEPLTLAEMRERLAVHFGKHNTIAHHLFLLEQIEKGELVEVDEQEAPSC